MAEPVAPRGLISVEEYLELEESSAIKHEYVGGMIFDHAGASDRHNRIGLNIAARLLNASRGSGCRVYANDMKLQVGEAFYYPDVMVVCEPPETDNPTFRHDPCLLVEILSAATEAIDRREKLLFYKNVPILGAYLIFDQDRRRVERHHRDPDGVWHRAELVDEGQIPVPCPPDAELTLDEVYEGL